MIAETILGHGDQAHDYYTRINPSAREAISEIHRCEAICVRPNDRRTGRAHLRRGQEFLAERHCRLELRGDFAVYPGHPP